MVPLTTSTIKMNEDQRIKKKADKQKSMAFDTMKKTKLSLNQNRTVKTDFQHDKSSFVKNQPYWRCEIKNCKVEE